MSKKVMVLALSFMVCMSLLCSCWGDSSSSSSQAPSSKPTVSSSVPNMSSSSAPSVSASGSIGTSSMPANSGSISGSTTAPTSSTAAANAAVVDNFWELTLVNAANPLPEDFKVSTCEISGYEKRAFDARAACALEALLSDAKRADNNLYLVSAYRSISKQKALFERKTAFYKKQGLSQSDAERAASAWVARPGTSEHNLGLAADIVSENWYSHHNDLNAEFDKTKEYDWLAAHAQDYGFILRYPKGKENITGISYEPWHYRYVGINAARKIKSESLTLEEYKEKLQ